MIWLPPSLCLRQYWFTNDWRHYYLSWLHNFQVLVILISVSLQLQVCTAYFGSFFPFEPQHNPVIWDAKVSAVLWHHPLCYCMPKIVLARVSQALIWMVAYLTWKSLNSLPTETTGPSRKHVQEKPKSFRSLSLLSSRLYNLWLPVSSALATSDCWGPN